MSALSIAEKDPSPGNIGKLRACFSTPQHVSEFIGLERHTPRGVALLAAVGMEIGSDRYTKALEFLYKRALGEDKRVKGLVAHFHSKMDECFRRVSVLEDRRRAFPSTAEDPLHPLPAPSLAAELDSLQTRLSALEKQAELEPTVKKHGKRLANLGESLESVKKSAANFKLDTNNKLDRYRAHGQQIDRLNTLTARIVREPERNDSRIQSLQSQISDLRAENRALKGTVGLLVKFAKGEIDASQVRISTQLQALVFCN